MILVMPRRRHLLASLSLILATADFCCAQTRTNTVHLTGVVRDQAGLTVPGARIDAGEQTALSDSTGVYALDVPVGLVRLEVSLHRQTNFRISLDMEEET
jgi:hypothetical protein